MIICEDNVLHHYLFVISDKPPRIADIFLSIFLLYKSLTNITKFSKFL